jgi:hypothetical protein
LFNAETITAPASSVAVKLDAEVPGGLSYIKAFQVSFASSATATVNIQASAVDVDAEYTTVPNGTLTFSSSVVPQLFTDIGPMPYWRVQVSSQSAGGAITATIEL